MDLEVSEHNKQVHNDIEEDIQRQGDGLFTCILRIHNGKIVDYNVVEYSNIKKYLKLKRIVLERIL